MKFKNIFAALFVAFMFAAPQKAHAIHFYQDNVEAGQDSEVNCAEGVTCAKTNGRMKLSIGVIGDVTPAAITGTIITATQYVKTMYYTDQTRPASGAPAGTFIVKGSASSRDDCGVVAGGTSFAACVSDGTNWIAITSSKI